MAKRRTKKQREAAQRKRQQRRDSQRTERFVSVLATLGVLKEFRKQPAGLREHLSRLRYPRPQILLAADTDKEPESTEIGQELSRLLDDEFIALEDSQGALRLVDFFCIGVPLWHFFGMARRKSVGVEQADRFISRVYAATTDHIAANLEIAVATLIANVERVLIGYSRIDRKLFWVEIDYPKPEGGATICSFRLTVNVHRVHEQRREVDGAVKRLYRCGAAYGTRLDWISWTAAELGVGASDKALPVMIDSGHALRNLRERVNVAQERGLVELCMWMSLREPRVVRVKQREEFLVEYYLMEYKLGYFVFKALEDMYVAKTFLFLTMDGTPEGAELWSRLRLTKKDKQYTGLDRLSTFVLSDMKDDPELVAVFEKCGCAHLFELTGDELTDKPFRGTAADVKGYLGGQLARALKEIQPSAAALARFQLPPDAYPSDGHPDALPSGSSPDAGVSEEWF